MASSEPESADRGLTPRVAGWVLVALAAAMGVLAAVFISHPLWGVPAAILLAVASVGVLAGLLLLGRRSWSDKTWPPGMRSRPWDARRERRQLLVFGVFILVASVAGTGGLLFSGSGGDADGERVWVMIAVFAVAGIAFVAMSLRPVPAAVGSGERPVAEEPATDAEWVALGREGAVTAAGGLAGPGISLHPAVQAPVLLITLLPALSQIGVWAVGLAAAAVVTLVTIAVIVSRHTGRPPRVHRDGTAIRRGRRQVPASEITAASLFFTPWTSDATARSLTLTLEAPGGFRAAVGLRKHGRLMLSARETHLLSALIERSGIELPRDKEDPTGKFSKSLYPAHLIKADALALVRDPPADGDALPIRTAS